MKLKEKLIKLLGGITTDEAKAIESKYSDMLNISEMLNNDLKKQISRYDAASLLELESLNEENNRVQKFAEETREFAECAMKAISKGLHSDPIYGFPKSLGYPGSVYGTSAYDQNTNQIVIDGRVILDDQFSYKFESAKTTEERIHIIQTYMKKYGVYENIGKSAVRDGAITITIGYNENNTVYEIYYHMNTPRDGGVYIKEKDGEA